MEGVFNSSLMTEGEFYKTITNQYSKQQVNIFLTIVKKSDPHRPPYLPVVGYDNFWGQIKAKDGLSEDDLQYLNRIDAYFSLDKSLQFGNLYLNFNDHISPFNIQKVIEVIENIEPSKTYSKDVDL